MNRKERRATATRNKAVLPTSFGPEASRLFESGARYHHAGRLDEAISHYQSAIDRKSNFLAARKNLGLALMAHGKLQEAVAQFRKAIALKPDFIEFYNNLGRALFALGRIDEAMATLRRALARGGSPETKILFVVCARLLDVPPDFDDFFDLMGQALSEPWSRPGEVGAITAHLLQQDKSIKPHIERAARTWPPRLSTEELLGPHGLSAICEHRLLRCLLVSTPVCGVALERFLTALRFAILSAGSATASSAAAEQNTLGFAARSPSSASSTSMFLPPARTNSSGRVICGIGSRTPSRPGTPFPSCDLPRSRPTSRCMRFRMPPDYWIGRGRRR
jgi:tetratricopeptide (TPR) repeat protein